MCIRDSPIISYLILTDIHIERKVFLRLSETTPISAGIIREAIPDRANTLPTSAPVSYTHLRLPSLSNGPHRNIGHPALRRAEKDGRAVRTTY